MASVVSNPVAVQSKAPFALLLAPVILLALLGHVAFITGTHFTLFHLQDQDLPVLLGAGLTFFMLYALRPSLAALHVTPTMTATISIFAMLALALWWLTYGLMDNFGVSYDEYMVLFDMDVFAGGRLAEPLAPEWRSYAKNLVPAFLLNDTDPNALVSAYLPMNAVLRLAFSSIGAAGLMNPLLFAMGGVALYDIARRHFGKDDGAVFVALLVYAMSMQAWTAAMTPYAMTGHLALNLVWLAAFLRGGRWHVLAISAGVIATGLHQLVFHPLFVAPFLFQRLLRREYRLISGYTLAYGFIVLGWIIFPSFGASLTGVAATGSGNPVDFLRDRVLPLIADRNPVTTQLMVLNLLRFFAWQHLALLPLLIAAWPLFRQRDGLALPLVGGIVAAIALLAVVLPYQGHGWGYRYLHGYIGSFALLGAMGYSRLRDADPRRAWAIVAVTSIATVAAMAWLAHRTHAFVAPHVALERHVAAIDADFVIIETEPALRTSDGQWAANAIDVVRNRPDLTNRPVRLSSQLLASHQALALCKRGSIAFVDRNQQKAVGFSVTQSATSVRFDGLRNSVLSNSAVDGCRVID